VSRIRMKVFIRNESDATLALVGDEIEHGEYTPGWHPPRSIPPGDRKGFQGEGDAVLGVPTTGTEGRVRYQITGAGPVGEIYIHWNSPLIESQYANTFHVWAPPQWEVSHWGGQGHEAQLEVRLRRTARRTVRGFSPRGRAFVFANSWDRELPVISVGFLWNRLFESLPGPLGDLGIDKVVDENWLPITHADAGMCGGMVFAVMDYFHHHLQPPETSGSPTSRDDPLFQYIRDRLWDSFDVGGQGHRWLGYSSPHYPNGDEGVLQNVAGLAFGRSWISYREAWPQIQADIDAGRLSPIGLVQTDNLDIGSNHQVLAYAYEKSGQLVTLHIYDPNKARQEAALEFDVTRTDGEVRVKRMLDGRLDADQGKRIWCFFRLNGYVSKTPVNGRRISSVREAVLASTSLRSPLSVRQAMRQTEPPQARSVREWLGSL
jgi:hypothetical protein